MGKAWGRGLRPWQIFEDRRKQKVLGSSLITRVRLIPNEPYASFYDKGACVYWGAGSLSPAYVGWIGLICLLDLLGTMYTRSRQPWGQSPARADG